MSFAEFKFIIPVNIIFETEERKTRNVKAKACLFSLVSKIIFTRIMNLNSAKDIWDYLKSEYQGSERTKGMKALNLAR